MGYYFLLWKIIGLKYIILVVKFVEIKVFVWIRDMWGYGEEI